MEFGSKFVYDYPDSEEESISDDEYAEGMNEDVLNELDAPADEYSLERPTGGSATVSDGAPAAPPVPAVPPPPPPPHLAEKSRKKKHKWLLKGKSKKTESAPHAPPPPAAGMYMDAGDAYSERRWRRADTNVIAVKFDKLTAPSNMHTGDPEYCTSCRAVFSSLSKLVKEGDQQVWPCEFCGTRNMVDLAPEEIPKEEDTTFMLQPAPSTTASGRSGTDQSLVIFCIDTSGSMCVTTEVPGKVRLRGDHLDRLQSLNETRESQYLPRQSRNVTYVSRLQGVQAAVDHQLGEMQKEHPNRRVALVHFSSEVTVVGDGSIDPVHISGDKLSNMDELKAIGSGLALPAAVQSCRKTLGDKVFDLEEGGQTALGPALVVSVAMACQVPGSKVIICTDGMANVGLGSLDVKPDDDVYEMSGVYYSQVSQMATDTGVSVSVLSIKGTDCRLAELGRIADSTGGQVNIVDPLKLTQEFGSILADPIIATNVKATLQLHAGLYFRHEESKESRLTKDVGNVTKSTEVTFEYGVRHQKKRKEPKKEPVIKEEPAKEEEGRHVYDNKGEEKHVYDNKTEEPMDDSTPEPSAEAGATAGPSQGDISVEGLSELPFQLQIEYTDLEGAVALRLISHTKPITKDRATAEGAINIPAIGSHTAQTSARWALDGHYGEARKHALMYQRLVHRNVSDSTSDRRQYANFYKNVKPVENLVNKMQHRERARTGGITLSDDEDEGDEEECDAVEMCDAPSRSTPPAAAEASSSSTSRSKSVGWLGFSKAKPRQAKKKSEGKLMTRLRTTEDKEAQDLYTCAKTNMDDFD